MSASVADLITLHSASIMVSRETDKRPAGKCLSLQGFQFGDLGCDRAPTAPRVS